MRIVIIGAGLAGVRAAEALRGNAHDGEIVLLGDEPHAPYERPPLSKELLARDLAADVLAIQPASFYAEQRIELRPGQRVTGLDGDRRAVVLAGGERLAFDRLLITTGATPRRLGVEGEGLDGVMTLRSLDDARRLRERLGRAERVVVIGAGLLGLEVAAAARRLGKVTTVVDRGERPLSRLLAGHRVADVVTALHRSHGVSLHFGRSVRRFLGDGAVAAVELDGGTRLEADLVLVSIGVRPNVDVVQGSGVRLDDGILVDAAGRTNRPDVYAAGDVARVASARYARGLRLEQYGHAHQQALVVARAMVGGQVGFDPIPSAGSTQFDTRLQVTGLLGGHEEVVVDSSLDDLELAAYFIADGRLQGAFTVNRPKAMLAARKLVQSGEPVTAATLRDRLAT